MRFCERSMRRVIVAGSIYLAAASLAQAGTTKGQVVNLQQVGIDNVDVEVLDPNTHAPLSGGGVSLTRKSTAAGHYEIPIPDAVTRGLDYRVALKFSKVGRVQVILENIDAKSDNTISVIQPELRVDQPVSPPPDNPAPVTYCHPWGGPMGYYAGYYYAWPVSCHR